MEQGFIDILQTWIKIDKSIDEDNSIAEACKVCIFTIQNEQKFLVNIPDTVTDTEYNLGKLSDPVSCLLYRKDHTKKNALIKLRKHNNVFEIVAFKMPDGEIKEKYTIPLHEIVGIRCYQEEDDPLFKESVFISPGGLFQRGTYGLP
jgi:hypothetical protein